MTHLNDALQDSRKRIVGDFEALLSDAEGLVQAVAGATGDSVRETRDRIAGRVASLRRTLADGGQTVVGRAREADAYVHANPWPAIAAALAAGVAIGLISRTGRSL